MAHEGDVNTSLSLGMAETMVIFFLSSFSVFLLFSNVINIPPPLPEPTMLQLPEYLYLMYSLVKPILKLDYQSETGHFALLDKIYYTNIHLYNDSIRITR